MKSITLPRGIRNNNPGNLRPGSQWQGLASPSSDGGPGGGYLIFKEAKWGIRAMTRDLLTDFNRDGQRTIRALINEYAPPADKNDTTSYVREVSKAMGIGPDALLDLASDTVLAKLVTAIIRHENGQQPYSAAAILEAVRLAR